MPETDCHRGRDIYTTTFNVWLLVLAGAGTGVLGAILGTGGGVFLIPILVLGFGVPMHYALATSILSVIATSSAVASTNVERGTANMRLGMTLEIATALGAIGGGTLAGHMTPSVLQGLFALVLIPTAWAMWQGHTETLPGARLDPHRPELPDSPRQGGLDGEYFDEASGQVVQYRVHRLWAGLIVSFFAGTFSGLLGIGGGVFKVPALHILCQVPMKAAAATSNFMIGVTAAASAFLYFGRGEVRPTLTTATVIGVLLGSTLGLHLNRKIESHLVKRLFAVLLAAVAVQMAFRAWTGKG